jgi:hypothetical protein
MDRDSIIKEAFALRRKQMVLEYARGLGNDAEEYAKIIGKESHEVRYITPTVLLPPPVVGLFAHSDLAAHVRNRCAPPRLHLRLPKLLHDLLHRVAFSSHRNTPFSNKSILPNPSRTMWTVLTGSGHYRREEEKVAVAGIN